jgi:hypothetical protein
MLLCANCKVPAVISEGGVPLCLKCADSRDRRATGNVRKESPRNKRTADPRHPTHR